MHTVYQFCCQGISQMGAIVQGDFIILLPTHTEVHVESKLYCLQYINLNVSRSSCHGGLLSQGAFVMEGHLSPCNIPQCMLNQNYAPPMDHVPKVQINHQNPGGTDQPKNCHFG